MANPPDSRRDHNRRAQLEARMLCKFQHPNIVQVFDAGTTDDGLIYIIMELLRGRTLREVLGQLHKLTVYEALSIGAAIADGVEVAHRQQVIHRDLKPENIFILENNAVKVLDFGIAKFLALTGVTTQRDMLQGTMWYISPEHVQGFGVTPRSDIYALGSVLYEVISGTPPCLMNLQEVSTQSIAYSQISRVPPRLDTWVPGVSMHVGRLIQRMLVKAPADRYASMAEVAEILRTACKRILAEQRSSAPSLRELWHDGTSPSQVGSLNELDVADTYKDQRTPKVMHPTVEVRKSGENLVAPSVADGPIAVAASSVDVDPNAPPTSASAAGSNPEPQTAAPAPAKGRIRRWQIVVSALAIGTAAGVVIGFHHNDTSSPGAKAPVASVQPPTAASSVRNESPNVPAPATPTSASAMPSSPLPSAAGNSMPAPSSAQPLATGSSSPSPSGTVAGVTGRNIASIGTRPTRARPPAAASSTKVDTSKTNSDVPKPKFGGSDLD